MTARMINSPSNIGDNVIRTAHILDDAITRSKIVDGAINGDKIADASIDTDHMVDESITSDKIQPGDVLRWVSSAPASATDAGVKGDAYASASYIYICVATNTWVRASLATW